MVLYDVLGPFCVVKNLQVVFRTFARANHSCLPNCTLVDGQRRLSGLVVSFLAGVLQLQACLFTLNAAESLISVWKVWSMVMLVHCVLCVP